MQLERIDTSLKHEKSSSPIIITIDVEDWFQVENLRSAYPTEKWNTCSFRVKENTRRLLDLFEEFHVEATFFVLGWVAERCPDLVQEIKSRNHEIASHGYGHQLCSSLSKSALREDLSRSKTLLEDITGETILGYRAPSFSVTEETLKVLAELGYKYDSSYNSFAINNRHGRIGEALRTSRAGTLLSPQGIIELPISNLTLGPFTLPWGGGGYFRFYPPSIFKWGVKRLLRDSKTYVFYAHPWEFDSTQPRANELFFFNRFRHYVNLHKTFNRMRHFLLGFRENRFVACRTYIKETMC